MQLNVFEPVKEGTTRIFEFSLLLILESIYDKQSYVQPLEEQLVR